MSIDWHERWREGRIGFHEAEVHSDLLRFADEFLPDDPCRILVPLCGKSVDMLWLAKRGHEVVGIELVERGVQAFFAEAELEPVVSEEGAMTRYQADNLTVLQGDVFDASPELVGPVDRIWDRAALVALPPDVRPRYVAHLRSLLAPQGAMVLQNTMEYDRSVMDGPPFAIAESEVQEHYGDKDCRLLRESDEIEQVPKFQERGHKYWTVRTHLIRW